MYYETLKENIYTDYLTRQPKKAEVINNSRIDGKVTILPDSHKRAIRIETETEVYLQSYDTLIIRIDKVKQTATKLWYGYSATTMKHINEFMYEFTGALNTFNKKEWEKFKEFEVYI